MTLYWESPDKTIALHCGDALDVLAGMPAESVSCILTDPPYNVGKDFGNGAQADRRPDYLSWLNLVWAEAGRVAKEGSFLIYTNRIAFLPDGMRPPEPWRLFHVAVWHKPLSLARCWYGIAPHWEPIFILVKGNKPWRPFRGPDVFSDVFKANVCPNKRGHPTEKPEDLICALVAFGCSEGDVLLDPFIGVGTSAVASIRLGRRCIGIDLSQVYLDAAIPRIERAILEREYGVGGAAQVERGQGTLL